MLQGQAGRYGLGIRGTETNRLIKRGKSFAILVPFGPVSGLQVRVVVARQV